MPQTKKYYKDMNKYYATQRKWKRNWRERTGSGLYEPRPWDHDEDEIILKHEKTDRELSVLLQRSAQSIQIRRWRLKAKTEGVDK
jgi:hypothetical protein